MDHVDSYTNESSSRNMRQAIYHPKGGPIWNLTNNNQLGEPRYMPKDKSTQQEPSHKWPKKSLWSHRPGFHSFLMSRRPWKSQRTPVKRSHLNKWQDQGDLLSHRGSGDSITFREAPSSQEPASTCPLPRHPVPQPRETPSLPKASVSREQWELQ